MYRERKRYKPVSYTLRRAIYTSSRILIFLLFFALYQITVTPYLREFITLQMISVNGDNDVQYSSISKLEPLNQRITNTQTLYNLSFSTTEESTSIGGQGIFVTSDPRVIALRQFLIDYNSPMYPYAEVFILEADKYGLDWRLLVAISGVESAFGNLIPPGSFNGWGWKGDPMREWSHFNSWAHAIEIITRGLALGYGITLTPFDIEPTYCPPCGRTEGHPWANGVTRFMNEMQLYVDTI